MNDVKTVEVANGVVVIPAPEAQPEAPKTETPSKEVESK